MASDALLKAKQPAHAKQQTAVEKAVDSIKSLLWICSFLMLAFYVDLYEIVVYKEQGTSFYISVLSTFVFLSCFVYIAYYLPKIKGIRVDYSQWETQIPRTIQLATVSGIVGIFSCVIALWPFLGIVTPLVLITGFMAFISVFEFV